ncbi:MAG: indole-3-glycerol-phosphate synthase [Myxococcales bacterium]|nr:indole-3-glycerol-phosphate synthase [Myxococcales bacterium]
MASEGVLGRILEQKRQEVAALQASPRPQPGPAPRPLRLRRGSGPLRLICEIKRRSPSAGDLDQSLSVVERAQRYAAGGADMLSVLTDERFFGGAFSHIAEIRAANLEIPILCKEFVIDEIQLDYARHVGADAVLLIVRCLGERTSDLLGAARARGLAALVEIVDEAELRIALEAGAELVGVNSRDLDTLQIDVARAARVLAALPSSVVAAQLSGLRTAEDVAEVARSRADAALIGETLMRRPDPSALLESMRAAAARSSSQLLD